MEPRIDDAAGAMPRPPVVPSRARDATPAAQVRTLLRELSHREFDAVCRHLSRGPYAVHNVSSFLAQGPRQDRANVILRHDVDLTIRAAHRLARIERRHGLTATYYVRTQAERYSLEDVSTRRFLRYLQENGFEIGYHYETLYRSGGDREKALRMFEEELARLRALAPVTSIASHGNVSHVFNWAMWGEGKPYRRYGVTAAYHDLLYDEAWKGRLEYWSDSGGTVNAAEGLMETVRRQGPGDVLYILIHPVWWGPPGVFKGYRLARLALDALRP